MGFVFSKVKYRSDSRKDASVIALGINVQIKTLEGYIEEIENDEYVLVKKVKELREKFKGNIKSSSVYKGCYNQLKDLSITKERIVENIRKLRFLKLSSIEKTSYNILKDTLKKMTENLENRFQSNNFIEIDADLLILEKTKNQISTTEDFIAPSFSPDDNKQEFDEIDMLLGSDDN